MNFGYALERLNAGERIARRGWDGKGMWLVLVRQEDMLPTSGARYEVSGDTNIPRELLPWIGMKTADNKFVPWLASQTDILATDWEDV
jgi:hypothetical protein